MTTGPDTSLRHSRPHSKFRTLDVGLIETAANPPDLRRPYFGQGLLPCLLPKGAEVAEQNAFRWGSAHHRANAASDRPGTHLGLAPEAEQWNAENRPTRRLMKASSKERLARRPITALSRVRARPSDTKGACSMKSWPPYRREFALVRGLKSPRALRREQPGCAGADPESKPDRSLLPSSLRAIRRVVVATRESPFQSPVFQGGHILGP